MTVTAHLTDKFWDRFSKIKPRYTETRSIDIPREEITNVLATEDNIVDRILDLTFKYGQNDFQPVSGRRSVSVGDIIEVEVWEEFWRVDSIGFTKVSKNTMED